MIWPPSNPSLIFFLSFFFFETSAVTKASQRPTSEWPTKPGRRTYPRPSLAFPRRGIILPHNAHLWHRRADVERWPGCFPMDLWDARAHHIRSSIQDRLLHRGWATVSLSLSLTLFVSLCLFEASHRSLPFTSSRFRVTCSTRDLFPCSDDRWNVVDRQIRSGTD